MANNNEQHALNSMMDVTLEKIRQMVDSNTIIGNPITTADGTTILPVSHVSFGFASGGSDFASGKTSKDLFGGGSGAGVSITPIAFLSISNGNIRLIQLADRNNTVDRAINMLPELVDKVTGLVSDFTNKDKKKAADKTDKPADVSASPVAPAPEVEPETEVIIDIVNPL